MNDIGGNGRFTNGGFTPHDPVLRAELEKLRQEHRDLDAAIAALQTVGSLDQLQLQRLKKRKLFLRDRLAQIEDESIPDIIA